VHQRQGRNNRGLLRRGRPLHRGPAPRRADARRRVELRGCCGRCATLEEPNDEWAVGRRYWSQEWMNKLPEPTPEEVVKALLELEPA